MPYARKYKAVPLVAGIATQEAHVCRPTSESYGCARVYTSWWLLWTLWRTRPQLSALWSRDEVPGHRTRGNSSASSRSGEPQPRGDPTRRHRERKERKEGDAEKHLDSRRHHTHPSGSSSSSFRRGQDRGRARQTSQRSSIHCGKRVQEEATSPSRTSRTTAASTSSATRHTL